MDITVIKQDPHGREIWRYHGRLLQLLPDRVVIEGIYDREDMVVGGLVLERGDRFVETYFTKRWYNTYEIYTQSGNRLKGWYCNVGYPAEYRPGQIAYRDLALDLIVFPDGHQIVLDQDEFQALGLKPAIRAKALKALAELQNIFSQPLE